jgi:UDPglucose 6-dehydrogenase
VEKMKIGIIGFGHVGKAMFKQFPNATVYDGPLGIGSREELSCCDAAFVCVPTPEAADGSCDTATVNEVLIWLDASVIIIRSTVPVGFTDSQIEATGKRIVFQPEYYGETAAHPFSDLAARSWLTIGGSSEDVKLAVKAYQSVCNAEVKFVLTEARTAELAKYMENCYLALKVTFCNEFYDIAQAFDVDYSRLREVWLEDPRIGRSHTFVYEDNRGFSGKCLPKDLNAILHQADEKGINVGLMRSLRLRNEQFIKNND